MNHSAAEPQPNHKLYGAQPPSAATEKSSQVEKILINSNAEGAEGNGFQITNYQLEITNSLPPPSPYPVTIETPL